MSEFKAKVEFNEKGADLLIKSYYYAPSVQCSYYQCVQMMLHILYTKMGFDFNSLKTSGSDRKEGTHVHATYLIETELLKKKDIGKCSKDDIKYFQKHIGELKKLRVKSDYKNEPISQSEATNAQGMAVALNNIIRILA
jgi:hypothetical protein